MGEFWVLGLNDEVVEDRADWADLSPEPLDLGGPERHGPAGEGLRQQHPRDLPTPAGRSEVVITLVRSRQSISWPFLFVCSNFKLSRWMVGRDSENTNS